MENNKRLPISNIDYDKLIYLVILLGFSLRLLKFFYSGPVSFDEAWSYWVGSREITRLLEIASTDKHPPVYYLAMHFWNLFYHSEYWIRIPSLVASFFSILIFLRIVRDLFDSKVLVLLALLLFALDPYQIQYSSVARMYSIFTTLLLVSVYSLLQYADSGKHRYVVINVLANILAASIHYTGIFIIPVQFAFILFLLVRNKVDKKQTVRWMIYHSPILVLMAAAVPYVINQISIGGIAPEWIGMRIGTPGIFELVYQITHIGINPFRIGKIAVFVIGLIIGCTIIYGWFRAKRGVENNGASDHNIWLFAAAYVTPIVCFWLYSQIEPVYVKRYFISYNFALYVVMIYIASSKSIRAVTYPIIAYLLITFAVESEERIFRPYQETAWDEKVKMIEDNWQEGDVLLVFPTADYLRVLFYVDANSEIATDRDMYTDIFRSRPEPVTNEDLEYVFESNRYQYNRIWFHEEIDTGLSDEFYLQEERFIFNYLITHFPRDMTMEHVDDHGHLSLFLIE